MVYRRCSLLILGLVLSVGLALAHHSELAEFDPSDPVTVTAGTVATIDALCRIDTLDEMDYYRHGGILHYVLRKLAS